MRLSEQELAEIREHTAEERMSCTCYWHNRTHEERRKLLAELDVTRAERDEAVKHRVALSAAFDRLEHDEVPTLRAKLQAAQQQLADLTRERDEAAQDRDDARRQLEAFAADAREFAARCARVEGERDAAIEALAVCGRAGCPTAAATAANLSREDTVVVVHCVHGTPVDYACQQCDLAELASFGAPLRVPVEVKPAPEYSDTDSGTLQPVESKR